MVYNGIVGKKQIVVAIIVTIKLSLDGEHGTRACISLGCVGIAG